MNSQQSSVEIPRYNGSDVESKGSKSSGYLPSENSSGIQRVGAQSATSISSYPQHQMEPDEGKATKVGKLNPFSYKVLFIYLQCLLNFLSIAITLVAAYAIVNVVVNGNANVNSSESAFINTTVYFLANVCDLIFAKYNAALSDYIGRKPSLLLSQLALFISRLILLGFRNG